MVFDVARQGDPEAVEVMCWAGDALGQQAIGVINLLDLQAETFEVALIGSLHDGSPVLNQALREAVCQRGAQNSVCAPLYSASRWRCVARHVMTH